MSVPNPGNESKQQGREALQESADDSVIKTLAYAGVLSSIAQASGGIRLNESGP